jgi:hypothetical protein
MARSARAGATIAQFLRGVSRDGLQTALRRLNLERLAGLSFEALFAAIIDSVLPTVQSIDDDIARQALFDALITLTDSDEVDLSNLTQDSIQRFFQYFICSAILHRYMADVAAKGLNVAQSDFAYERIEGQVRDFIEASVAGEISAALEKSTPLDEHFAEATITSVFEAAWTILESVGVKQRA